MYECEKVKFSDTTEPAKECHFTVHRGQNGEMIKDSVVWIYATLSGCKQDSGDTGKKRLWRNLQVTKWSRIIKRQEREDEQLGS